jgi:hypothetical protein
MRRRVRIGDAKQIAKEVGADGVAVFAFVDGNVVAASYGETKDKCARLGKWLDGMVDDMCAGKLPAPDL